MMRNREKFNIESNIQQLLILLLDLLSENETVKAFRLVEKKIDQHEDLQNLTKKIKTAQKEAVKFAHYGKPEAERQAIASADLLTEEFNHHPLVIRYRELLVETDDLLQFITKEIEEQINDKVIKTAKEKLANQEIKRNY